MIIKPTHLFLKLNKMAAYKPPRLRIKKATPKQREVNSSEFPVEVPVGVLLVQGNVWITDRSSVQRLTCDGCYGNKVVSRATTLLDTSSPPAKKHCPSFQEEEHDSSDSTHSILGNIATNLTNSLHLLQEESFYLVHHSLIKLITPNDTEVSLSTLWNELCSFNDNFPERYLVYYQLRQDGWIPKSGHKFGVHFLAYKQNPSSCHSTYAIVICRHDNKMIPSSQQPLSWQQVVSVTRVNESAGKDMVICCLPYLAVNDTVANESNIKEILDSLLAERFNIKFIVVKRWLPEKY